MSWTIDDGNIVREMIFKEAELINYKVHMACDPSRFAICCFRICMEKRQRANYLYRHFRSCYITIITGDIMP